MTFRYLHDCGGIHACGPAWDEFGWECVGMTEIEKFPIAVVKHHYHNLIQYGDTTKFKGSYLTARIDLLVGGTPCQGFSVAGKRGGLDDPRSGLAWNFLRLAAECNPRWILWENVPGASSANEGQDLLAFAQEVGKLGYGFAWRTLDAQYFGVPQRRRRIFLVGYLGDWRPAAAVLFDPKSLRGNITPGKKMGERTSNAFEIGPSGNRETAIAPTLDARCKDGPIRNQVGLAVTHTLRGEGFDGSEDGTGRGIPLIAHPIMANGNRQGDHSQENYLVFENHGQDSRIKEVNISPQLNAKAGTGGNNLPLVMQQPIAFDCVGTQVQTSTNGITQTLRSMGHDKSHANRSSHLAVASHGTVRRLTPLECGRLQGFPDNWCQIPWKGKPAAQCPDGPQYKAYGNSIAVTCLRYLGRKIQIVERLLRSSAHA